jgi:hypothetical protein
MLGACGDEDTGALIVLTPDSDYNSEDQVAEPLVAVQLMFDAEQGFHGINPADPQAEGFQTLDLDGDGQVELFLELDVSAIRKLPLVRLDPGGNLDKRIAVRARGIDAYGEVAAYGGLEARKLFVSGELYEIKVPFNLAFSHLPPRIIAVTPRTMPNPPGLAFLAFYSSKPLSQGSLANHVHVTLVGSLSGSKTVAGNLVGPSSCPFGAEMWKFVPDECYDSLLESRTINLKIDPEVTDSQGQGIQDATGNPGFEAARELASNVSFGACTIMLGCHQLGTNPTYAPDLICNDSTGMYEPARCSVDPLGCEDGRLVFDALSTRSTADCQAVRFDTYHHPESGSCVIEAPWPCNSRLDCSDIGEGECDGITSQCVAEACDHTGGCQGDFGMVCVEIQDGCLPRIGGCTADCSAFHGCPELDQDCTLLEVGAYQCR